MMKNFLKTTTCILAIGALVGGSSCSGKNEEEAREEANASVVNIEKGVASPVWTSEGDGKMPEIKPAPPVEPKEEIQEEAPEPAPAEEKTVSEEPRREEPRKEEPKAENKPSPKPSEQPTAAPAPTSSSDSE